MNRSDSFEVHIDFAQRDPHDGRAAKNISFPFTVRSLADAPQIGDQFILPTWDHANDRDSSRLVKVVARRVGVSLGPGDMHRRLDSMYVTVMVDEVPKTDPRF